MKLSRLTTGSFRRFLKSCRGDIIGYFDKSSRTKTTLRNLLLKHSENQYEINRIIYCILFIKNKLELFFRWYCSAAPVYAWAGCKFIECYMIVPRVCHSFKLRSCLGWAVWCFIGVKKYATTGMSEIRIYIWRYRIVYRIGARMVVDWRNLFLFIYFCLIFYF